MRDVDFNFGRN